MFSSRFVSLLAFMGVLALSAAAGYAADDILRKEDLNTPGSYRSGDWEYKNIITSPGSKSEGQRGTLIYGGKELFGAAAGDYYETPWGKIEWVGDPEVLWGGHGWFLRDKNSTAGRELPAPWLAEGSPVVMAMILVDGDAKAKNIEPWVSGEVEKLGAKGYSVQRPWFVLGTQVVTITDTKLTGRFAIRSAPARDAKTLTVICDGSDASNVILDRKDDARKVIRKAMGGFDGDLHYYVAFKVVKAAPDWPKPMDIGADSDGKEVVVKDAREVIITLPGDRASGCEWIVKSVQGDNIKRSSVMAVGIHQFTPGKSAREGTFENTFKIMGTGKTYVELEYKRSWQTDKPAEKVFKVTLDVLAPAKTPETKPAATKAK